MNICIIPSAELSYESGSTIYAHKLSKYLSNNGNKVFVICSKLPKEPVKDIEYRLLDIMEHPVIDDYPVSNERMFESIERISKEIMELNDKYGIDVIHAHYGTINSMAAMNAKIILGIPYVVSCFGRDVFNGRYNDSRYSHMMDVSIPYADYVVCSNNEIKDKLLEIGLIKGSNNCIVRKMPIDTYLFCKQPIDVSNESSELNILSVASCFAEEKGIIVTLETINSLKQEGYDVKLSIVGCDEHPEKKNQVRYEDYIEKNDLQDCVKFVGQISNEEVAYWLNCADVLVDSRLGGNYSSVILEALFSKTFVIASDVQGNTEFIRNGFNGLLYKTGDSESLKNQIKKVIYKDQVIDLCKNGIEKWVLNNEEEYSFIGHVNSLEKIYREVI